MRSVEAARVDELQSLLSPSPHSAADTPCDTSAEHTNNTMDLCDRLGLTRNHRRHLSQRGAITHSSSPVARRADVHKVRSVSDAADHQGKASSRRLRSGSRSRADGIPRQPSSDGKQKRGSSVDCTPTATRPSRGSSVSGRRTEGTYAPDSTQKYRPIGRHNRLRQQVTCSRHANAGLVLDWNIEASETSQANSTRQTHYGMVRPANRGITHLPTTNMWKDIPSTGQKEVSAVIQRSPRLMVPSRPRSATGTIRTTIL